MKKLIFLSLVGIGIYLFLTRKAQASEATSMEEIPQTPSAPENPAIDMVEQIVEQAEISLPEVKISLPPVIFIPEPAPEPAVPMTSEECRNELLNIWRWPIYSPSQMIMNPYITDPCGMLKLVKGI